MPNPVGTNNPVGFLIDNPNHAYGIPSSDSPHLYSETHHSAGGGIGGGGNCINVVSDYSATGDGVTDDTAAIQAAIDSGAECLYFPAGTYRVENLTVSARETMALHGDGSNRSILKLRDNDGLGGTGQIFILTDVIKAQVYDLGFHGNYANAKAGSSGNPLVRYIQTAASAGRKDCVWDVQRCWFEESAKGWGHCRAGVYENSDDNLAAEFERVTLRDIVSLYHGTSAGALNIRGPAQVVDIENIYVRNDGQYGMVTVGQASSIGSNKLPIGLSAEGPYWHFLRNVTIRNVTMYRTYGGIFLGMCSNPTIDGFFDFESCTNPYYDTAPIEITAVDVVNNKLTSAIPTTTDANNHYGASSIVRFTTTGTLPAGLSDNVLYFVKTGVVGNTFQVSTTSQTGTAVDITDAGTGTHSIQWLGYSFANSLKCDDNIWYADNSPGHIVVSQMVTAKSTPHTSHSSIGLEASIDYNGNAADNASVSSRITIRDSNFDSVVGINDAAANIMTEIENCVFESGWIPPLGTVGATTTISSGNASVLAMLGGTVRDCIFGIVQIGNIVINPTRDLTIQNCRFRAGITIVKTNNIVVQLINNLWNFGDVGDKIVEVTPPTAGNKGLLRMVGNHVPANAAFATKLRLTTGKDLSNFDVFLEDNDLTSDTGGVSDFGNAALRLTAIRNRNAARAASEFPRTTLAASATPAITGGMNMLTGSATPITNFTGGFEYQRIRVYIDTGHQVNNTATIVTRSGANIAGPAVTEFIRYQSVWREV